MRGADVERVEVLIFDDGDLSQGRPPEVEADHAPRARWEAFLLTRLRELASVAGVAAGAAVADIVVRAILRHAVGSWDSRWVRSLARGVALVPLLVLAGAVQCAAVATAGTNTERAWPAVSGRLFTLSDSSGDDCGPVGLLPDGGLLLAESRAGGAPTRVWRLGIDGVRTQAAVLARPVGDLFVDGPASMVVTDPSTRRIERVDLASGATVALLDLPSQPWESYERVIALDDGSLVVYDGARLWRVQNGVVRALLAATRSIYSSLALAPLAGGAFAFVDLDRDHVVRVERDGRRRVVARLGSGAAMNAALAARGDELVIVLSDSEPGARVLLRIDGTRVVDSVRSRDGALVYGDGDGFGASALAMVAADRAWLAADGALVLSTPACSVRALVPRTSPRARVALRRSAWHAFEDGKLPYYAGAAGSLRLTVRRARGPVVFTATGTTEGGLGHLRIRPRLARGTYDVQLELITGSGGVAQTHARIVTLSRLSVDVARKAVVPVVSDGDGDGGDGWETEVGRCVPRTARHVACRVKYSWYSLDESGRRTCRGWAGAWLRRDGVRVSDDDVDCGSFQFPPTAGRVRAVG